MWTASKSLETRDGPSLDLIAATVGESAADRDADGCFPSSAFDALRRFGLVARAPISGNGPTDLFRLLAAIGRGDLSVGRIFEGHINAQFLIHNFGTVRQRERYGALTSIGKLFGVWNTDVPGEVLTLEGRRLRGRKAFATGVDGLSYAIVTAGQSNGRQMIVVPVSGLSVDRSWWRPLGMRASGSHVVDLTGLDVEPDWVLGAHNDYVKEPWFTGGAIRFAAVHAGGMHAVLDAVVTHLRNTNRTADPYQRHRLGHMGTAVESGYAWLDRASAIWANALQSNVAPRDKAALLTFANAARGAVESLALSVLEDAERSVGAAGLIAPHPLERLVRDLRTYLRQPNPDGALSAVGSAIADGSWVPGRSLNEGKGQWPSTLEH